MIFPLLLYPGVGSAPCKGDEILPLSLSQPGTISGTNQGQNQIGLHRWRPRPRRSKLWCSVRNQGGAGGCTQSKPCSDSGNVEKNGEPIASGWTAEHTSWRNPGQRQGGGAGAASNRIPSLDNQHRTPRLRDGYSGRQTVGPPRRPPARRNYWSVALGSYP